MNRLVLNGVAISLLLFPSLFATDVSAKTSAVKPLTIQKSCFSQFKDYDAWMDFLREKNGFFTGFLLSLKYDEDSYISARENLECRYISYQSDGMSIKGYLVKPKNAKDKKLPVVIYNRGGNQAYGALAFANLFHYIFPVSSKGYIVLASQYRGSIGPSTKLEKGKDQFGGQDVNDVVALVDLVDQIEGADADNIFMLGQSRGGMMSLMALKQRSNINAVATIAGEVDLEGALESRPEMEQVYSALIPNYADEKTAELRKRSALFWAEELPKSTPILILHGTDDKRVNVASAYKFDKKLKALGRDYKMVIYDGDNHFLAGNREQAIDEIDAYFQSYLKRNNN